jgi:hypothetical protein
MSKGDPDLRFRLKPRRDEIAGCRLTVPRNFDSDGDVAESEDQTRRLTMRDQLTV